MASSFQLKVATKAQEQYTKYRYFRENQEPLASQIRRYWEDLGFNFPGVKTAWSAVFVSWCAKQAGAKPGDFAFAARHGDFVLKAIANEKNDIGTFRGRDPSTYSPKVGDILQNNRSGNHFDFKFASTHSKYESHSAIVIEVGADAMGRYLRTVGGNETDSVGLKEVRLNSNGTVKNSDGLYICVIETLL